MEGCHDQAVALVEDALGKYCKTQFKAEEGVDSTSRFRNQSDNFFCQEVFRGDPVIKADCQMVRFQTKTKCLKIKQYVAALFSLEAQSRAIETPMRKI